jgi:hypothetical protein
MPEKGWLKEVLDQARQEVNQWPSWMKDQEPEPGQSYKAWSSGKTDSDTE